MKIVTNVLNRLTVTWPERYGNMQGLPHPEAKVCIEVIEAYDLPARFAGVGLARKIAMDAAALFLYHREKTEQPILSLDADTLVEKNYTDAVLAFSGEIRLPGFLSLMPIVWKIVKGRYGRRW